MLLLDKLRAARSLQVLPPAVRTGNQVKGACYVARRRHEGGGGSKFKLGVGCRGAGG